ncbi:MAG: hypothetical protein HGA22_11760 [Clostridiales bacterium]|nr:hypothetical protein [Clostridiales bacterium]
MISYTPERFNSTLAAFKVKIPVYSEMVNSENEEAVRALVSTISSGYATKLKNRELELLVNAYAFVTEPELIDKLDEIYRLRFRRKHFEICWFIFQKDFRNPLLLRTLKFFRNLLPEEERNGHIQKLSECLEDENGIFGLIEEMGYLSLFFRRNAIINKSGFAWELMRIYFSRCSKDGYFRNRAYLSDYFSDANSDDLISVASAYLERLEAVQLFREANTILLERWGMPGAVFKDGSDKDDGSSDKADDDSDRDDSSSNKYGGNSDRDDDGSENNTERSEEASGWYRIMPELSGKIIKWLDFMEAEKHFGENDRRLRLWAEYFNDIKKVVYSRNEELLVLAFGAFSIMDLRVDLNNAYFFCNTELAATEFEDDSAIEDSEVEEGIPAAYLLLKRQILSGEGMVSARDHFILGTNSSVYKLGYDRANVLYLKDMIKEGIV